MKAPGAAPGGGTPGHGNIANGNAIIMLPSAGSRNISESASHLAVDTRAASPQPGRLYYFALLSLEQQREAIRKLALAGMGPSSIAAAAQISINQVLDILAQNSKSAGASL